MLPVPNVLSPLSLSPPVPPGILSGPRSLPLPPQNHPWPPKLEATVPPLKLYCDLYLFAFFGTFCSISLIVNFHILSPCLQINSGQGLFSIRFLFRSIWHNAEYRLGDRLVVPSEAHHALPFAHRPVLGPRNLPLLILAVCQAASVFAQLLLSGLLRPYSYPRLNI